MWQHFRIFNRDVQCASSRCHFDDNVQQNSLPKFLLNDKRCLSIDCIANRSQSSILSPEIGNNFVKQIANESFNVQSSKLTLHHIIYCDRKHDEWYRELNFRSSPTKWSIRPKHCGHSYRRRRRNRLSEKFRIRPQM